MSDWIIELSNHIIELYNRAQTNGCIKHTSMILASDYLRKMGPAERADLVVLLPEDLISITKSNYPQYF